MLNTFKYKGKGDNGGDAQRDHDWSALLDEAEHCFFLNARIGSGIRCQQGGGESEEAERGQAEDGFPRLGGSVVRHGERTGLEWWRKSVIR